VTVRVRSLVIALAVLVAASAVVWSLHWATGLQPLAPGILTLAFGAVSGRVACGQIGGVSSVTLHFTTLGVFHGTQVIDLGDEALNIAGRCP
jgi:hypothetical protein